MRYPIPKESYAVIVANGAECALALTKHAIALAEKIVVLDNAYQRYNQLDLPYHCILGDFDHGNPTGASPEIEIIHTPDQESTDLEKGIHYLIQLGFSNIMVIWATGKRTDHTFINITDMVRFPMEISIQLWDDHSRIYRMEKNFTRKYQKDAIISLIPIGTVFGVSTKNLKFPLYAEDLVLGGRNGNSNVVAEEGEINVTYTGGELLMMECWDEFDATQL